MALYLILSSVERIIAEIFRAKDDRIIGAITVAQILSVALIALGAYIMRRASSPMAGEAPA